MLSLDKEVFPFDELAFPGVETETLRENVMGYNAGVDMTWRFTQQRRRRAAPAVLERQERVRADRCAAG